MDEPSVWTRFRAARRGEISAASLRTYYGASLPVFELWEGIEAERRRAIAKGETPWDLSPSRQAERAYAWCAFVLQVLGNEFLDADDGFDPPTRGFLPPVTADQVSRLYAPIEGLVGLSRQAGADVNHRFQEKVAELPPWNETSPSPPAYVAGLLGAMRALQPHAGAAVASLGLEAPENATAARQFHQIRGLHAAAEAKAHYVAGIYGSDAQAGLDPRIEPSVKETIEALFDVGRLAAIPKLVQKISYSRGKRPSFPLPGDPGFDPWCLTDPRAKESKRKDREARDAILRMWDTDPDPEATLELIQAIRMAEIRRDIRPAEERGKRIGPFQRCPWSTVYEVDRMVALPGEVLLPATWFALDIRFINGPFERHLHIGRFLNGEGRI
ncbi:hypothetical protein EON79_10200 [bacterium]|nr:MAG: hypothetical protein EON79_10200 [bacterium]